MKPTSKAPGTKCSNLKFDELLSSFPFHFNLRRYGAEEADTADARASAQSQHTEAAAMEAARALRQGRNTRPLLNRLNVTNSHLLWDTLGGVMRER